MTKDELRRKFIVATPDAVGLVLKLVFVVEDNTNRAVPESEFETMKNGYNPADVDLAWGFYTQYRAELAHYAED